MTQTQPILLTDWDVLGKCYVEESRRTDPSLAVWQLLFK